MTIVITNYDNTFHYYEFQLMFVNFGFFKCALKA